MLRLDQLLAPDASTLELERSNWLAILLGIPIGIAAALGMWRWANGTVTADSEDAVRFFIVSGMLLSAGVIGVRAAHHFRR